MATTPYIADANALRDAIDRGDGCGVRIAILDSGVESGHPALAGIELADDIAFEERGSSLAEVPGNGVDVFGHGTAIAGVIRDVAPAATLGSFRVLDGTLSSRGHVIRTGALRAMERGYHILSCSFGTSSPYHLALFKGWLDDAFLNGIHVVAACNNFDVTRPEWPGHFTSCITVNFAATEAARTVYRRAGRLVEFSARGVDIELPWKDGAFKRVTGSSYAAPRVAGILARLLSVQPGLSPLEAKSAIRCVSLPWSAHIAGSNELSDAD